MRQVDNPDKCWTQAEQDTWIALFLGCIHRLYPISDQSPDPLPIPAPDYTPEIAAAAPDDTGAVEEPHDAVNPLDLTARVVERSRESKTSEEILGYTLTPAALKRNREARAWSAEYLSSVASVHRNAITRFEAGDGMPLDWQVLRLAAAFLLTETEVEE